MGEIGNAIANATSHQGGVNVSAYAGIARRPSVPRDIVSLSAPGLGADMHLLRQTSTISTPRARCDFRNWCLSAQSASPLKLLQQCRSCAWCGPLWYNGGEHKFESVFCRGQLLGALNNGRFAGCGCGTHVFSR